MNIYLISQDYNNAYDTYDSAVVAAENEEDAKTIHPSIIGNFVVTETIEDYSTWAPLSKIKVKYIGSTHLPRGVICASFNAG